MQNSTFNMPMIGCKAPRFIADSTIGPIKLTDYIGKWLILFSYPENFNPICASELIALSKLNGEFNRRNCELLALSSDSKASNIAWVNDLENNMNAQMPFPIISDCQKEICNLYGMQSDKHTHQPTRNVYFIDPHQKIRCMLVYPIENGRNTSEILRILDCLCMSDKENMNTPVNWLPGNVSIKPSPRCYIDYKEQIKRNSSINLRYLPFDDSSNLRRW